MEPFLALGEELQQVGHPVAFCMPAQFEALAREVSPHFYPMTSAFLDLVESDEVKKITGQLGSPLSRVRTVFKLLKTTAPLQHQLIRDQKQAVDHFGPDTITSPIKCIYPIMTALRDGQRVELLSPVPCLLHAVDFEPAIGFGRPRSRWWNRFTYSLANRTVIQSAVLPYGNVVAKEWGWPKLEAAEVRQFLLETLPVEYAVSPDLFPEPLDWPEHVRVSNFRERNKAKAWTAPEALLQFLKDHPRPLFVSFGSMINARPKEVGQAILNATAAAKVPVLINTSWGGIELPDHLPGHAFAVKDVPYDWLFAQVRAVVHHGGSGTTHSALQFQLPQLIVPHIGDQFLWARRVQAVRMGPKGFGIKEFSEAKFGAALQELLRY